MKLVVEYHRRDIIEAHNLPMDVYSTLFHKGIVTSEIKTEFSTESGRGRLIFNYSDSNPDYGSEGLTHILKPLKLDKVTLQND